MNYQIVGANMKRFRKGKMTQAELASKVGKSVSSIKKYELGLVEIPSRVIEDIAAALGISTRDLYGYELGNKGEFEHFLSEMGYTLYQDDPEHAPFLITDKGTFALEREDVDNFRNATCGFLKFTVEETLKKRNRM